MRFLSSESWRLGVGAFGRRRLRRSFLPVRLELNELNEPWVEWEEPFEKAAPKLPAECEDVNPVSCDVIDGALFHKGPDPLLDPSVRRFERHNVDGDADSLPSGISVEAIAFAISVIEAGSFSGGLFFHLSKGFSSSHDLSEDLAGMGIAAVVGRRLGDIAILGRDFSVTLRRRRAFASQFAI